MIVIFVRTVLLYVLLTLMFRFMGKRQVGELEVSDLVSTLLLSEIAALPIDDPDIPLLYALVPILLIMCLEIMTTFAETKWNPLKRIFEGKPILLISQGEVQPSALKRVRVSVNELISECRLQGVGNIGDVNYAILEPNGKLSVFPKSKYSPVTPSDLQIKKEESGILHPLIIDGIPQKEALKKLNISSKKLHKLCEKQQAMPKDMFLLGMDDGGQVYAVKKEKKNQ